MASLPSLSTFPRLRRAAHAADDVRGEAAPQFDPDDARVSAARRLRDRDRDRRTTSVAPPPTR